MTDGSSGKCRRPMRAWVYFLLFTVGVWAVVSAEVAPEDSFKPKLPKKRQIYREAVLPARGGIIPQGAFTKQRLQHNIHDQLGIEAPDGTIFISRTPQHTHEEVDPEDEREILRLFPSEQNAGSLDLHGHIHLRPLPTTYLIRRPALGRIFVPGQPRFRSHASSLYHSAYPWPIYAPPQAMIYQHLYASYK
ncbi:uncharacterized protein LOC121854660 [Homarus americanus]|uniref:Uncharacterized protein n=1 Tax=Homarus americanus TaxID=6706 RepID=A0A8J5NAQ9_HOMAM|nr:uncharacterized protein LOC121854660 [Homarus americanus]XP_042205291.1 uncharacterized protein LOC121854660 [Homarus americanus]XP_042205299.1 uncharacterized protein LOC121854660 [Homarus americanus]XP_042205307.1 uncharacterized protein LOC121854660 [Homarus americanus]XP_042205313.1 uncharacterized protein LOC121854660 [Homarus americanus]XP_042205323.1 uncharacterized protein LOC121854660 [Homarus americanus]XP_042205332.1 uncharacterized protein LOC121854660 [Homarus americanus]XP_0